MSEVDRVKHLLEQCSTAQRKAIFDLLRVEFPIHALETKWNIPAELILEAIDRSSDLIKRGVRGIIAEVAFRIHVVAKLKGWDSQELVGNLPYDFVLEDKLGRVRVQVKMQRLKEQAPMMANQGYAYQSTCMLWKRNGHVAARTPRREKTRDPTNSENLMS